MGQLSFLKSIITKNEKISIIIYYLYADNSGLFTGKRKRGAGFERDFRVAGC